MRSLMILAVIVISTNSNYLFVQKRTNSPQREKKINIDRPRPLETMRSKTDEEKSEGEKKKEERNGITIESEYLRAIAELVDAQGRATLNVAKADVLHWKIFKEDIILTNEIAKTSRINYKAYLNRQIKRRIKAQDPNHILDLIVKDSVDVNVFSGSSINRLVEFISLASNRNPMATARKTVEIEDEKIDSNIFDTINIQKKNGVIKTFFPEIILMKGSGFWPAILQTELYQTRREKYQSIIDTIELINDDNTPQNVLRIKAATKDLLNVSIPFLDDLRKDLGNSKLETINSEAEQSKKSEELAKALSFMAGIENSITNVNKFIDSRELPKALFEKVNGTKNITRGEFLEFFVINGIKVDPALTREQRRTYKKIYNILLIMAYDALKSW